MKGARRAEEHRQEARERAGERRPFSEEPGRSREHRPDDEEAYADLYRLRWYADSDGTARATPITDPRRRPG